MLECPNLPSGRILKGGEMEIAISRKRIITILVAISLLLTVLSLTANAYKVLSGHARYLVNLFDFDREMNFPSLFRALCIFAIALNLFGLSLAERRESQVRSRAWRVLSFAFLIVGTDDLLALHEACISPIKAVLKTGGFFHFAWVIPWGLAALCLGLFLLKFFGTLPKKTRNMFYISAVLFLLGAIAFEMIGGKIATSLGKSNVIYYVETQVEEILELSGVLLFFNAVLDYQVTSAFSVHIKVH